MMTTKSVAPWFFFTFLVLQLLAMGRSCKTPREVQPELIPAECDIDDKLPPDERFQDCILVAANEKGINPTLVWALIKEESGFDPKAGESGRAVGLMGILPTDALPEDNLQDPKVNITAGARRLAEINQKFSKERDILLAYVSSDPKIAQDWISGTKTVPTETHRYVSAVLAAAAEREQKLKQEQHLKVLISFRSFEKQAEGYCSKEMLAVPGQSAHQLGLAVDVIVVDGLGNDLADMPGNFRLNHNSVTPAARARAEWLKDVMARNEWQATHWDIGEWRHFEFDQDKAHSSSKPTTASAQFDCAAWQAGHIPAPPEPEGLVTKRLNSLSRRVRLTSRAFAALVAAEANLTHASRSGR